MNKSWINLLRLLKLWNILSEKELGSLGCTDRVLVDSLWNILRHVDEAKAYKFYYGYAENRTKKVGWQ